MTSSVISFAYFTTVSPSLDYAVYAAACVCRELYGKINDRKTEKLCNNYLNWKKVSPPQMCHKLVSCADFKDILMLFSEVI